MVDDLYHAGPGTSLRHRSGTASGSGTSQGVRPLSQAGRPMSGFLRPGTMSSRPKTIQQAVGTARSRMTARCRNEWCSILLHRNLVSSAGKIACTIQMMGVPFPVL